MNIPRFWRRGVSRTKHDCFGRAECWGWSVVSEADAQAQADARADKLAASLKREHPWDNLPRWYDYPDRPIREEIIRELPGTNGGSAAAVVTRNAFGCLVLNTTRMLFADIDLMVKPAGSGGGWLRGLFGRPTPAAGGGDSAETKAILSVKEWLSGQPGAGVRVYRTKAGLRLLLTHRPYDPESPESESVLQALSNDPLYIRLCRAQKCYRARLTPKPWRCGVPTIHERFPFATPEKQAAFTRWVQGYEQKARGFSTCQFVETLGGQTVQPEFAGMVALHDELCGVARGLPLA